MESFAKSGERPGGERPREGWLRLVRVGPSFSPLNTLGSGQEDLERDKPVEARERIGTEIGLGRKRKTPEEEKSPRRSRALSLGITTCPGRRTTAGSKALKWAERKADSSREVPDRKVRDLRLTQ